MRLSIKILPLPPLRAKIMVLFNYHARAIVDRIARVKTASSPCFRNRCPFVFVGKIVTNLFNQFVRIGKESAFHTFLEITHGLTGTFVHHKSTRCGYMEGSGGYLIAGRRPMSPFAQQGDIDFR